MIGDPEVRFLKQFLPARTRQLGADVLAIGIVCDHVHLIQQLPGEFNVPKLVQSLKGASARIANRDPAISLTGLRWARGYDFRSLGPRALRRAIDYVKNQAARHPDSAISPR